MSNEQQNGTSALILGFVRRGKKLRRDRVLGIDVARGLAILGMLALHAIPLYETSQVGQMLLFVSGEQRVQILFAVLDGLALGILSDLGTSKPELRPSLRRAVAIRGVLLVAVGLSLATLNSGIEVILDHYGVFFLLLLPALWMSRRAILLLAVALLLLGPAVNDLAADSIGDPARPPYSPLVPVVDLMANWLLVGFYPAVIFLGYVLCGLWLARLKFWRDRKLTLRVSGWGIGICGIGYLGGHLVQDISLLSRTLILIGSVGATVVLIGLLVLAGKICSEAGGVARAVFLPFERLGEMPITIYSLQILVFGVAVGASSIYDVQSLAVFFSLSIGSILFAMLWAAFFERGPLEALSRVLVAESRVPRRPPVAKIVVE